jgi:hypothetical protein
MIAKQVENPFDEQLQEIISWHLDQAPEHVFYGETL